MYTIYNINIIWAIGLSSRNLDEIVWLISGLKIENCGFRANNPRYEKILLLIILLKIKKVRQQNRVP